MRQEVAKAVVEAIYHKIDAIAVQVEAGLKTIENAATEVEAEINTAHYGKLPRYARDTCRAYWQGRARSLSMRPNVRK